MKKILLILLIILVFSFSGFVQPRTHILYKQVDTTALYLDVFYPKKLDTKDTYPAIIFFFGGGWISGNTKQFEPYANYFSGRGMICILADYRVKNRQQTTPFESLSDAKSAIRYLRSHAKEMNIDPNRIVASGGSAGGQLAAATSLIKGFNDVTDDLLVSCIPDALILFNPVIDNGPGGYGYERVGEKYKDFSPLHNIKKGAPPTIIFLGTSDKLIPVETVKYYQTVMKRVGSRCDLILYEGQEHGFFNKPEFFNKPVFMADKFLHSLGYIKGEPMVKSR